MLLNSPPRQQKLAEGLNFLLSSSLGVAKLVTNKGSQIGHQPLQDPRHLPWFDQIQCHQAARIAEAQTYFPSIPWSPWTIAVWKLQTDERFKTPKSSINWKFKCPPLLRTVSKWTSSSTGKNRRDVMCRDRNIDYKFEIIETEEVTGITENVAQILFITPYIMRYALRNRNTYWSTS